MSESFVTHVFLILLIAAFSSCADKPMDNSLTIDAYKELGMPDLNKQWDMADYTQAHNVLAKLKWEKQLLLPIKDSDKSGLLFEHMLSLDYLSFLQDSTMSRSEKAERISKFGVVYDYWIDVYSVPTVKPNYYNREIADIRIFNLRIAEAAFTLANEIIRSDDPSDVALHYGYNPIKRAYLECLNQYLQPKSNAWEFADQDMERMIDSIHQSVIRTKEWMDATAVNELKQSLRSAMDSTSSARLRDKYKFLENQLPS